MKSLRFLVLLLLTSLVCSPLASQTAESIVGVWFGEGYQPILQMNMVWVISRSADGSKVLELRQYRGCELAYRQVEKGRWKLDGSRFVVTTQEIDGVQVHAVKEYLIENITETEMTYVHVGTSTRFQARRISPAIGFPPHSACTV